MPRRVVNVTRNTVVCEKLNMAEDTLARLCGLMMKPGLSDDEGLWFDSCNMIHSMFMRFEFDAVFLDKTGKVLHLLEKMKPWGISPFVRGGQVTLELNGGVIAKTGIQVGDTLEIQDA